MQMAIARIAFDHMSTNFCDENCSDWMCIRNLTDFDIGDYVDDLRELSEKSV